MRLYIQQGLSARVVQALHRRLARVVSMAGEGGPHIHGVPGEGELRGNDAEGDRADRSRSPARAALGAPGAALGAPGAALEVTGMPAAEGRDVEVPPNPEEVIEDTIGNPEISMMMASKALAQSILACSRRIAAMSEELNQAMEGYNEGRLELVKSLGSIKEQLALHAHGATAMGSTVAHQSNEVKKLLAAFDKFSHIAKWSLKGNNTLEDNIGSVKEEVGNRGEKIEQAIKVGLGEVTGLLRDLIRVIGEKGEPDPSKAPGMPMPERMEGYPSFPLQNVPSGVGQVGTPATPGMAGMTGNTVPSSVHEHAPKGASGHGSSAGGVPVHGAPGASACGLPTNVQPPQVAPPAAPSVTMPAGLMTPPALPESLFVGFCPINPGEQRPAMSLHPGLTTPGQRQGAIMSKDATSGEVRTLSPTPYKGAQVNALISLWAPGGLAMLRDGQQQCRRVYQ